MSAQIFCWQYALPCTTRQLCDTCYQNLTTNFKWLPVVDTFSHSHCRNVILIFLLFDIANIYIIGIVFVLCLLEKNYRLILLQISQLKRSFKMVHIFANKKYHKMVTTKENMIRTITLESFFKLQSFILL